jgi:hypothetical protein
MCFGIALVVTEVPEELVEQHRRRIAVREPGNTR